MTIAEDIRDELTEAIESEIKRIIALKLEPDLFINGQLVGEELALWKVPRTTIEDKPVVAAEDLTLYCYIKMTWYRPTWFHREVKIGSEKTWVPIDNDEDDDETVTLPIESLQLILQQLKTVRGGPAKESAPTQPKQ